MSTSPTPDPKEILDRMTNAFFALDRNRRFTYLNERGHEVITEAIGEDLSTDELCGRRIWDEIPEAVGTTFYEKYEQALDTNETVSFEEFYEPLDTWFEVHAYPSDTGLSVYFHDITERKQAREELEATVGTLSELYALPTDTERSFEDRCETLIELGRDRLDVPFGVLSEVADSDQTVVVSKGDHPAIQPGLTRPLEETYCRQVVATGSLSTFHARDEGKITDPAYRTFGLDSYIGSPINVDGKLYGTLWFAATDRQEDGFSRSQRTFVRLAARWLGYELAQREYRAEIEQSKQQYRLLADNFPDGGVFLFDDEFRYTLAAGEALERVGLSPADIEGKTLDEAFPSDVVEIQRPKYEATLDGERVEWEQEYQGYHYLIRTLPVPGDGRDSPGGMVATLDITERKRREDRIRGIHDIARELGTCETHDEVYEVLVSGANEVLNLNLAIVDEAQGDRLVAKAIAADLDESSYYDETPIEAEDNLAAEAYRTGDTSIVGDLKQEAVDPASEQYHSAMTVPIGDHAVLQAVSTSFHAFTHEDLELVEILVSHGKTTLDRLDREQALRDQTEQLRAQNERLDEFVNVVSHDLRSPLTTASGHLDLARRECESKHLDKVKTAHDRMATLIDDLLVSAKKGTQVQDMDAVRLHQFVHKCWETVETREATLRVNSELTIRADRQKLRQLLENLLRNATEHAGSDVTLQIGAVDDGDGFYVADDGAGIPDEDRDAVFEFGYSSDDGGTGFGLAIVRDIAEAHGWSVQICEGSAGGARFEFVGVEVVR